ncbi:uncharacterized protein H6S33_005845 [Morchella sextelata]|uniref:uncharacterized protein n=1 Tax=Morchella sextelata TaxID=1174677 RepID=UPI001D037362|nr:uncharacterized protein H6S33_005845 [Morchella sextelata]KAH0613959.1 hypothetical protein H6S33_005845 [Morchella sextelata]
MDYHSMRSTYHSAFDIAAILLSRHSIKSLSVRRENFYFGGHDALRSPRSIGPQGSRLTKQNRVRSGSLGNSQ